MKLIDGKALAAAIRQRTKTAIAQSGIQPRLAAVLIGENAASELYLKLKAKACAEAGIAFERKDFPKDAEEDDVFAYIDELNNRNDVHAILIQLPLPEKFDTDRIIETMDPAKDVDGFHPINLEAIDHGEHIVLPVLVKSVLALIDETKITLTGKKVVIINDNDVFLRPFRSVLQQRGALVDTCKEPLVEHVRTADILISAAGRAGCITGDMLHDGMVVIDIGITMTPDGVRGDVAAETAQNLDLWLTPVPGGVGPVTVAMATENTALLADVTLHAY